MGTTIGAISRLINRPLPKKLTRAKPTAAMVPRMVARMVASGATIKLLRVARAHASEVNRFSYQRSDQAGTGYDKKVLSLNDSGTIARIGNSKNSSTSTPTPRSRYQPILSASVA